MPTEPRLDITAELLDEFYSEADQHLAEIRRCLIALEEYTESAQVDSVLAEALFRSFHSFKGNSAIVGLAQAEAVAHAAEGYLRQLLRGGATLSPASWDHLMSAAQQLEQIVLASRRKEPFPDSQRILALLAGLVESQPATATPAVSNPKSEIPHRPDLAQSVEHARAEGRILTLVVFSPSKALDDRGVNVTSIRQRIAALGELLNATPQVHPEGHITFEFLAALREAPSDLSDWEADGVTFQLYPESPPPSRDWPVRGSASNEPSSAPASPFIAPSHHVRVDLAKLDELMRVAGEMVMHRARMEEQLQQLALRLPPGELRNLQEVNLSMSRSLRDLREGIMRVRLVPIAEIFQRMPFVMRDLARETGLRARLVLVGQEIEIDKFLIESLKDPLLHLVRNAVSHGLESPQERSAAGKPPEATITLSAKTRGDSVEIEVADDGRGVDAARVALRAAAQGLEVPERLDNAALLKLICTPGFSTRDQADRASGRGVGMAVVERTVRELGGILRLESQPGRGTRFLLRLPFTLAIADVFLVSAGGQTFAIPHALVDEVVQLVPDNLQRVHETELLRHRDTVVPLLRLNRLIGCNGASRHCQSVILLHSEQGNTGLVVDRILGQREVVVRSMRDPLVQTPFVSGATELGDGRVVLILNAAALVNGKLGSQGSRFTWSENLSAAV